MHSTMTALELQRNFRYAGAVPFLRRIRYLRTPNTPNTAPQLPKFSTNRKGSPLARAALVGLLRPAVRPAIPLRHGQPAKNAVRKSKKSWEFTAPSALKSALGAEAKKAVRKSKKSWEFTAPS